MKIVPRTRSSTSIDFIEVENPDKDLISEEKNKFFEVRANVSYGPYGLQKVSIRTYMVIIFVNKEILRILRAGIRLTVHRSLQ